MTKKALARSIVLLIALSAVLVACGGGGPTVIRINTWENPSTTEVVTALNEAFMEEYPDIEIEFTTAPTAQFEQSNPLRIQAGDVDIWSGFGFAQKAQDFHGDQIELNPEYQNILAGLIEPLDDQPFLANYNDDAVEQFMTYDGSVYGICMGSVVIAGIYWNETLFAELGLDKPETYDELVEAAETLQANGYTPFTAAGAPVWPINMIMHGFLAGLYDDVNELERSLWTGGLGYEDPRYIEMLSRYQNLMLNYYEEGFQTIEYNPHIGRFATGTIGMLPDGLWQANGIAAAIEEAGTDFEFGYMQVPSGDSPADNQAYVGKGDLMWFMHADSKVKEEALAWLEFMSRPDNYSQFVNAVGWLPTQPVEVDNAILSEVSQYPIKLAFEQVHIGRATAGEYASAFPQYLTPMGTIETPEELVERAMADWNAAE